jgi:hypothetical protein
LFSWASCCQTFSVCVLHLTWETNFTPIQKKQVCIKKTWVNLSELSYHTRFNNLTTVVTVVICIWNNRKSCHSYTIEISVFSSPCLLQITLFLHQCINYVFLLFQLTMGLGTHIRSNWHYGPITLSQRWSQSYWIISLTLQKMEHLTMIKRMEIPPQNHKYWSIPKLKKINLFHSY